MTPAIDKTSWPDGPWKHEPDRAEFEHGGLSCVMIRNHFGAWCGYVVLPPGHPAHGKDHQSLDIDVHGGLTWSAADEIGGRAWIIGFDCAHSYDLKPGQALMYDLELKMGATYKGQSYCERETRRLADQLAGGYSTADAT